jgi:hypothetical protein
MNETNRNASAKVSENTTKNILTSYLVGSSDLQLLGASG